jgi:hypothetical protein
MTTFHVIPAKAGISGDKAVRLPHEMPAFAGMTAKETAE